MAPYQQKINFALQALQHNESELNQYIKEGEGALLNFVEDLRSGKFPAFSVVETIQDLGPLKALAEHWSDSFDHVVILGVGGSSLGGQMLTRFQGLPLFQKPNLIFVDNVDPTTVDDLLHKLPLEKTAVLAISKSGGTIETCVQTSLFIEAFRLKGLEVSSRFIGVTEEKNSPFRILLETLKIPVVNHPEDVGGRFSVTTLVGLLPACFTGFDAEKFRRGCTSILKSFLENPTAHEATKGAAISCLAQKQERNIQVMMPYSDRLRLMSPWFVQLWAESLGKKGQGTTPVAALGSTDQHSFLQLMAEGPQDKLITVILPACEALGREVQKSEADMLGQAYLEGLTCGTLISNQAKGTVDSLASAGQAVRVFETDALDEEILGVLVMHFMLEVAVAGAFMGVNTWDQPGVEDAKIRTMEYLTA